MENTEAQQIETEQGAMRTPVQSEGEAGSDGPVKTSARPAIVRQGFFYLVVGCTSALIELVLFQVLYQFGICSVEVSNIIALVTATTYNFILNGRVTFKGVTSPMRSLIKYLILFAFNMTFTTFTISWLVGMGWDSLIAKLCTMACVVLWNFVLYRKVVFT